MTRYLRRTEKLSRFESTISRALAAARAELVGREAVLELPMSTYHGRLGVIDAIMVDADGSLTALFMILRADGTDVLNSDADTRSYRPLKQLRLGHRRQSLRSAA